MTSDQLVLAGSIVAALSGVPGLLLERRSNAGQQISVLAMIAGCGLGLAGVAEFVISGPGPGLSWPSPISRTDFTIQVDALSAVFLLPIFVVSMLGSVYGWDYWRQAEHPDNGRRLRFFYGLVTASLALVVVARDGVTFLFAWEVMALAAFFLVSAEDHDPEARAAGWLYLASSHLATLALFGLFALLSVAGGTFGFVPLTNIPSPMATTVFLAALIGFGLKAGIMPLHFWLPSSHAMAPSHVSALMSGVIIKVGIYGLVRVLSLVPHPPIWWGGTLLALGVVSGVLGVVFAIGQHDLKRLLAYHSIENIGIIVIGLGLALLGRAAENPTWVVLGLSGALLHVWNHSLFKSLLFLSAGSVVHATGTREIDLLGGLSKSMPLSSRLFLVGAVAICGLPPLNGFVSELVIYLGLFKSLQPGVLPLHGLAAFAAPALALIGTLAVACFVKVFGAVFLGVGRSPHADGAHEAPAAMLLPMLVLAGCCFVIGLAPGLVFPLLEQAVAVWGPSSRDAAEVVAEVVPLRWLSAAGAALLVAGASGALVLRMQLARYGSAVGPTWGCGYMAPTRRMQYTASSFAEILVHWFGWALRPREEKEPVHGLFPGGAAFHSDVPDAVLEVAVVPLTARIYRVFAWSRYLQQGSIQAYLVYILVMVVILILWS